MGPVMETILARRSVRRFQPAPVSRETALALLEAGRYAPSGHNKQDWLFTAVLNPEVLAELNRLTLAGFAAMELPGDAPRELVDAKMKADRLGERYSLCYHAPCLIIASNDAGNPNAGEACACALENMFLAARELGLGSCWVNQLHWLDQCEPLRARLEELGIPKSHTICGSGAFGYPEGPAPKAPPRKEGTWQIIE